MPFTYPYQGMYKNRVKNDRKLCYFEFSRSGFPRSQDKRAGISKRGETDWEK